MDLFKNIGALMAVFALSGWIFIALFVPAAVKLQEKWEEYLDERWPRKPPVERICK